MDARIELPLDINHICRLSVGPYNETDMGRREQTCPACQYIRGFKDAQAHE